MRTSQIEPFYLLDQGISYRIVRQVQVPGIATNRFTSVREVWPDRDLDVDAPSDQEIIQFLAGRAGHRSLWITIDWRAFEDHKKLLHAQQVSVLWLRCPPRRDLTLPQQRITIQDALPRIHPMLLEADSPIYFRLSSRFGEMATAIFERLESNILDTPQLWKPVSSEFLQ